MVLKGYPSTNEAHAAGLEILPTKQELEEEWANTWMWILLKQPVKLAPALPRTSSLGVVSGFKIARVATKGAKILSEPWGMGNFAL